MKKIDLGHVLQTLGSVAVLAGILLLVYELNQNRAMMAAQIRNSMAQANAVLIQNEAHNPEVLDLTLRGMEGESLTPLEQAQFRLIWAAYFQLWENTHYQYRVGLFDALEYESQTKAWVRLLSQPGIRELWCSPRGRGEGSTLFVAEVDQLLGDDGCE